MAQKKPVESEDTTAPQTGLKNGVNTAILEDAVEDIKDDPEMAKCQFRTTNIWIDGGHNRARVKEFRAAKQENQSRTKAFYYDMDEPPILAGENRGGNPVELLLASLSGCVMTTMIYYAALMDIKVNEATVKIEGDIDLQGMFGLRQDIRPGYQQIRVKIHLDTDGTAEQEETLIELAQKHSPVYNTINKPVDIQVTRA